ncbi:MAG: NAD+ synthetase, partial [Gammaproteobacteria bacterium]|nr:NAD+ synthetase [Gammaproteobacteria bacterium]
MAMAPGETVHYLKVAGAALNQTPLDWEGNRARIVEAIRQARAAGVQVLCLPELCVSGYGCEDAFHGEWVAEESLRSVAQLLPETRGLAVAVGLPLIHQQNLYNCAALLVDGRVAGFFAKQVLAGYGVYYEPRWFKAWPAGVVSEHLWEGQAYPIGDLVFDLGGVRVGFEICEDAWARRGIAANPVAGRADLLLNPSASHFAFGKYGTVRGIVQEGSRQGHAVYL